MLSLSKISIILIGLSCASAQTSTSPPHTATDTSAIGDELATSVPQSPVSHVKGKVFDRFVNIMLENTDFDLAASDPNMAALAKKGITLTNFYGATHPSQPNYVAVQGGDFFGMDSNDFKSLPYNVSNVWDILADKGVSFAAYQECLPYPGFEGFTFKNPVNGRNCYDRRHNPAVQYDSNMRNPDRHNLIKSFDAFAADVKANTLPQHIFLTPDEWNDAHDSGITYGANWLAKFLEPLLENKNFMNNTLLLISFDENGDRSGINRPMGILISDTMPKELLGTSDASVYTQYSCISTVEANWDLETLGRWDVGANVFKYVADITGDVIREPEVPIGKFALNGAYKGALANDIANFALLPIPNTNLVVNGRKVRKDIITQWGDKQDCTSYEALVVPPEGSRPPKRVAASCYALGPSPIPTSTSTSTSTSTPTPMVCNRNNCLRHMIRSSAIFAPLCTAYTSITTASVPTAIPECENSPARVSSACSCLDSLGMGTTLTPARSTATPV